MKTALITGGGSGIGQALAWQMAKEGLQVYIVGRRLDKLESTAKHFPNQIHVIAANVSLSEDRQRIASILKETRLDYLIHNAATADPLSTIADLNLEAWRQAVAVNGEAPVFLTQALLNNLNKESRILNISSSLSRRVLLGTSTYSMTKAALHMAYLSFNAELNKRHIYAGSVMPGVVDTEMQTHIRTHDKTQLPNIGEFIGFKEEGKLRSPDSVANLLSQFLQKTSNEIFTQKDWAIDEIAAILS